MAEVLAPSKIFIGDASATTVTATGNGIGGYTWSANPTKGTCTISSNTRLPPTGRIGAGAEIEFEIGDIEDGCEIRFVYKRDWEDKALIERSLEITRARPTSSND